MASTALASQAQALLSAANAGLAQATTGRGAPTHQFRSHGLPNLEYCCDDGELAVWLERIEHRQNDDRPDGSGCAFENYFHWVIGVYRCWPSGDTQPPTTDEYDTASADLLEDIWSIVTEFYDRLAVGSLLSGCGCEDVQLGDATPAEPEGGCAGWEFRVVVGASCLTDTGS